MLKPPAKVVYNACVQYSGASVTHRLSLLIYPGDGLKALSSGSCCFCASFAAEGLWCCVLSLWPRHCRVIKGRAGCSSLCCSQPCCCTSLCGIRLACVEFGRPEEPGGMYQSTHPSACLLFVCVGGAQQKDVTAMQCFPVIT